MNRREKALEAIKNCVPTVLPGESRLPAAQVLRDLPMTMADVADAESRLNRFAPYLALKFPNTRGGIIESPLTEAQDLAESMEKIYSVPMPRLLLKRDSELPVAGSVKARGGIHEILALAESVAMKAGLLSTCDDYKILDKPLFRELFSEHKVSVGSTGNLGISVGVMAAELGFKTTVHMSRDAKEWKKALLRSKGVEVVEHEDDYGAAVAEGRRLCAADPRCHFVDDEKSPLLFTGYAVAALRLRRQLEALSIAVDRDHPLRVYLPCGVGGAPGGIAYGLKQLYGDTVRCWFVEPTHAPAFALAMALGTPEVLASQYGIDGVTEADGLAVGAPSKLVWTICKDLIDGVVTVDDDRLFELQYLMHSCQGLKAEPSAAAGLAGPLAIPPLPGETAVAWLTGGVFLPQKTYNSMLTKGKALLDNLKTGRI